MSHPAPKLEDAVMTRRELLTRSGMGMGAVALAGVLSDAGLLGQVARAAGGDGDNPAARLIAGSINGPSPLLPKAAPLQARAKRVVHLFMNGGPSHVDTFDPKTMLDRHNGKPVPTNLPTERKTGAAMGSPFKFKKYGQSGIEVSDLFAHTAGMIDEICVIRSMHADVPNHEPSLMLMNCGEARQARPCVGSWVLYGLGTENQNLPGFVVMCPGGFPIAESQNWQSAFLPGIFQGTYVDSKHTEIDKLIAHIRNHGVGPKGAARPARLARRAEPAPSRQERPRARARGANSVVRAGLPHAVGSGRRLRHQSRARDRSARCTDPASTPGSFWRPGGYSSAGCGSSSSGMATASPGTTTTISRPATASSPTSATSRSPRSLTDLKQRGMLEDTLVIWGGEFGRTPTVELPTPGSNQGKMNGRDHNHYGFTMWMAGGGVKGGYVHGATDDLGFQAVDKKVHVHDLHATLLHLLGFDHERFTYRHAGRDFRLTDVHGTVVKDIIA